VGDLALQAGPNDAVVPVDYRAEQLREAIERCLRIHPEAPTDCDREPWLVHARSVVALLSGQSRRAD